MRNPRAVIAAVALVVGLLALPASRADSAPVTMGQPGPGGVGAPPENIFGDDDRREVSNYRAFPNPAIGVVVSYWASTGFSAGCTGFFVGRRTVLTSAHCLYKPGHGGKPSQVRFTTGEYPSNVIIDCEARNKQNMFIMPQYVQNQDEDHDLGAVLTGDCNRPGSSANVDARITGWLGYGTVPWNNRPATLRGFDGDHPNTLLTQSGPITGSTDDLVYYQMDAGDGTSGSPVFVMWDPPGAASRGPVAVGVHSGGRQVTRRNWATRIAGPEFRAVQRWIARGPVSPA